MAREVSAEIRSYIKTRFKLGISAKAIFYEIRSVYGHGTTSYSTVTRWIKRFKSGIDSIESASGRGRPASVVTSKMAEKVKDLLKIDARMTTRQIARTLGISTGSAFKLLKKKLGVRRIAARWIPHLLTNEQKKQRVSIARKLLKMYPKFNQRTFSNIWTVDETWVHFFQPTRKCSNKIWATKSTRRPSVAKRTTTVKKVMFAIFFNSRGETVQVAIPRGRTVTGNLYQRLVMKKFEKYVKKSRPSLGLQRLTLLHDNAPAHTSKETVAFLEKKGMNILPHPPYSPDLAPCDFFLFPYLKKKLEGRRYYSRQSVGSAVNQCLKRVPRKCFAKAFKNWIKRLHMCICSKGEYFEGI